MLRRTMLEWMLLLVLGLMAIVFAYASGTYIIMTGLILFYLYALWLLIQDIRRHRRKL